MFGGRSPSSPGVASGGIVSAAVERDGRDEAVVLAPSVRPGTAALTASAIAAVSAPAPAIAQPTRAADPLQRRVALPDGCRLAC